MVAAEGGASVGDAVVSVRGEDDKSKSTSLNISGDRGWWESFLSTGACRWKGVLSCSFEDGVGPPVVEIGLPFIMYCIYS